MERSTNAYSPKLIDWRTCKDLELFLRVCAEVEGSAGTQGKGSLRKVALSLGVSPASVSQCLKRLEEYYGLPLEGLVERPEAGDCKLTRSGKVLRENAVKLIAECQRFMKWSLLPGHERIDIGMSPMFALYALPKVIKEFTRQWGETSKVDFTVREFDSMTRALGELEEGLYDLVVGVTNFVSEAKHRVIKYESFTRGKTGTAARFIELGRVAVVPNLKPDAGDPFKSLRNARSVTLDELASYPSCCSEGNDVAVLDSLDKARQGRRVYVNSTEVMLRLVAETGLYVGLSTPWKPLLERWRDRLCVLPIADENQLEMYRLGMCWRGVPPPSRAVEVLKKCIRRVFETAMAD
jgi:DNA-binding transcriptional LysR family regulator